MRLTFSSRRFQCKKCGKCCRYLSGLYLTARDFRMTHFHTIHTQRILSPFYVRFNSEKCPKLVGWGARVDENMKGKVRVMTIITGVKSPYILGPTEKSGEEEKLKNLQKNVGIEVVSKFL